MPESKKQATLKIPKDATKSQMEGVLEKLVKEGKVSAEDINTEFEQILEATHERVEAASKVQEKQLSPEQVEAKWLGELKTRFDALPQLHKGLQWADVEKALKADPESMAKLQALDAKGHAMNVFGEEKGEFVFASGWDNYEKVSAEHKNITYDLEGELAEKQGYKPNGNAVDIVTAMGVDLADPNFHEQLRKAIEVNGWAWLKTDAATRKTGRAFDGDLYGFYKYNASNHIASGSFRAALRVKKA
jgi:hypothetical protein